MAEGGGRPRAVVLTVSDRSFRGEREDRSGPLAVRLLDEWGFEVVEHGLVPDNLSQIVEKLRSILGRERPALIVTTGGTGFSPRDVTPEATLAVIERRALGVEEKLRRAGEEKTPTAALGRGISGISGESWLINLPGGEMAVRESLETLRPLLGHGVKLLRGEDPHEPGRVEQR